MPIALALFGAAFRRMMGGWLAIARAYLFGALVVVTALSFWLFLPWWQALILSGLAAAHWPMGHRYDLFWHTLGRYSIAPILITAVLFYWGFPWCWLVLLTGLATALGYSIPRWTGFKADGEMIDGWSSIGELVAGGSFYLLVTLALVLK